MPATTRSRSRSRSSTPTQPSKRVKLNDDLDTLIRERMTSPLEYQKVYDNELDYRDKLVLAPMVRTGSCMCFCDRG